MSKNKHEKNIIKMSDIFQKLQSGELILCGGSMFTDEENDMLWNDAVEYCLNKK